MTNEQLLKAYRDAYKSVDTSKQQQPQTQQGAKPAAPKK